MLLLRPMLMFLLALPMTVALAATGFEPVESIRAAALQAVPGGQAEASLDPALRMPACGQALEARQATAGTVEVSCPQGWRLFVPVKVRPKISTALTDPDGKNSNGLVKIHGELFYPRACSGEG